ncbi:MAG: hypothetical protein II649_05220 [Kiritimatiellae bacterium]|nr:hypothetical protein [Kiritimatiellia bacterium]
MKIKTMMAMAVASFAAVAAPTAAERGFVVATDYMKADGKADVSDAIQKLVNANPNRTIYFPDGTYLLSKPVCTPANPRFSVDLQLSNYAVFKAAPGWNSTEAMVRLGGIHPANDIRTPGSCYSLTGGVIDGSGAAKGVSIDSGRETKVQRVSMKNVLVGLHIKHGANSGSSDCDIADVNIVGNNAQNSIGVLVDGYDNTLSNMRIAGMNVGVRLNGGGNLMLNIHPLSGQGTNSVGFLDFAQNHYRCCYSDHFDVGFFLAGESLLDNCWAWWYSPHVSAPGARRIAVKCPGRFMAHITNMTIGFRGTNATNVVLDAAKDGGSGFFLHPIMNAGMVNEKEKKYLRHLVRLPLPGASGR